MTPMPKIVTVFSSKTCGPCSMLKRLLSLKGIQYNEVSIDDYPERRQEAINLSGSMVVPITVVQRGEDKEVIVGYNPSKIIPAVQ